MTDSTFSRPVSLDKAMNDCFTHCNQTDARLAYGCLDTLLARRRSEDDADIIDGVAVIVRFVTEAMILREQRGFVALQTLCSVIQVERNEGNLLR
jgi:hypothetical protein